MGEHKERKKKKKSKSGDKRGKKSGTPAAAADAADPVDDSISPASADVEDGGAAVASHDEEEQRDLHDVGSEESSHGRKRRREEGGRDDGGGRDGGGVGEDLTVTVTGDDDDKGEGGDDPLPPEGKQKKKRKRKRKKKNASASASGMGEGGNAADPSASSSSATGTAGGESEHERTAYVEGLPFDCTDEEVKGFFISNGCPDVTQLRLPKWQDSGRLRGYGHVVFGSMESKRRALEHMSGKAYLRKRYVTVSEPKTQGGGGGGGSVGTTPREQPRGCSVVFVKNLPYGATEDDVRAVFSVCGKIVPDGVRLGRNSVTRQSKGFGYVEYKNPEGAAAAVHKAAKESTGGITVLGRQLYVDYDEGTMKNSYRTGEGKLWTKEHTDDSDRRGGSSRRKKGPTL